MAKPVSHLVFAAVLLLSGFCAATFGSKLPDDPTFPFMASLEHKGKHICGATIIDDITVLTAAHCVQNKSVFDINLRISTVRREQGGFSVPIKAVALHPGFNQLNFDYDIAVMTTKSPLFTNLYTQKAALPSRDATFEGKQAYIVGWGAENAHGAFTDRLMYASIKLLARSECENFVASTERTMCAVDTVHSTCRGDGGGPVIVDNVLAGIISFAEACARSDKAMLFTKVEPFLDWISENNFTE